MDPWNGPTISVHTISIAVYYSTVTMWHEYCVKCLLLDDLDSFSLCFYSALWEADSYGFPYSWLVLIEVTNRQPWQEMKEKRLRAGYLFPGFLHPSLPLPGCIPQLKAISSKEENFSSAALSFCALVTDSSLWAQEGNRSIPIQTLLLK